MATVTLPNGDVAGSYELAMLGTRKWSNVTVVDSTMCTTVVSTFPYVDHNNKILGLDERLRGCVSGLTPTNALIIRVYRGGI